MVLFPKSLLNCAARAPPATSRALPCFSPASRARGKSTIANALMVKLMEMGGRPVTLLDGDIVRKNLSSELGLAKSTVI